MKKLRIISILLVVVMILPLAACDGKTNDGVITIGDCKAVYTGYDIVKDSDDDDAIAISYDFTNNSDEDQSFVWSFYYTIKQNDTELEYATVWVSEDSYDTLGDSTMQDVAPGETIPVSITYKLADKTSPVMLEFTDLFDTKVVKQTIDITKDAEVGSSDASSDDGDNAAETEKPGFFDNLINSNPLLKLIFSLFNKNDNGGGDNGGSFGGNQTNVKNETGVDWWLGEWYGWWTVIDGEGYYTDYIGGYWDCLAAIEEFDGEYYMTVWDEDYNDYESNYLSYVKLDIDAPDGEIGTATSSGIDNFFWNGTVWNEDWNIDPVGEGFDDTIFIIGTFVDSDDEQCQYGIVLNKWGEEWNEDAADTPYYYDSYFVPMFEAEEDIPYIFVPTAMPEVPENNNSGTTLPSTGVSGTDKLDANFFSLTYDGGDWKYDAEDDYTNNDYRSYIELSIPDTESEDDEALITAEITVAVEDPYTFRGYLDSYGFDHYEYAVEQSYDTVKVGGIDCLSAESTYWGDPSLIYMNRIEKAKTTVFIRIVGEVEDARVNELLNGLTIKAEDIGHTDGPWYWNGTPFSMDTKTVNVGSNTVKSEWIPFDECVLTKETFEHKIAIDGETAYILNDGVLKLYDYADNKLSYVGDVKLEDEYKHISRSNDGKVWLSNFMAPLIAVKDGQLHFSSDEPDYTVMHPSGTWGISWFTSNECEKVKISGQSATLEKLTFEEADSASRIFIDEDYIYVCGSTNEEKSVHAVMVYDENGDLKYTLKGKDNAGLGSVTYAAKTDNGFFALDGNMRKVMFWDNDGKVIDAIDDSDLFGTKYPWFCGATMLDDGSFVVLLTDERQDRSADEVVAFRVSGF